MTTPPTPPRIRLTISVSPEVHQTYRRMAHASGRSIGLEMGEWLAETLAAASHMTGLLEKVREAPRRAVQDIQNFTETLAAVESIRKESLTRGAGASRRAASQNGAARSIPPSSNTGGKPQKTAKSSGVA